MADFRSGVKLIGGSGTGNLRRRGFAQASKFGRIHPMPTEGTYTVLGQVAEDLFAEDEAGKANTGSGFVAGFTSGIAYPAGQLWTRVVHSMSGAVASTSDWFAVPSTLPAEYTERTERNLRPGTKVVTSAALVFRSVMGVDYNEPTYPVYTPTKFARTAAGIYEPKDLADEFVWGPLNRNTTVGFLFSSGVSTNNPVGTLPSEVLFMKHPGMRNIRIWHRITEARYALFAADFFLQSSINGYTQTTFKGDFSYDASLDATRGRYYKIYDIGPILAAQGTHVNFNRAEVIGGSLAAGGTIPLGTYPGVNQDFFFSPRLDIPLPWTASGGNLIAPGGILSGTIPGY